MGGAIKVEVNAVSLRQAVLCTDCDVITDSPHDACLVCGSHSLLPLSRMLGNVAAESPSAVIKKPDHGVPNNVLVLTSRQPHRHRHHAIGKV